MRRAGLGSLTAVVFSICGAAAAQSVGAPLRFPEFKVVSGRLDANELPASGARVCLEQKPGVCYEMPGHTLGGMTYEYALEPSSARLGIEGGGSLVFFAAGFNGGGPGWVDRLALLEYEPDGKIVNLLPYVGVSKQGEKAAWMLRGVSQMPVLVTADIDFDIAAGETRWDDHHFFVEAYRFDPARNQYVRIVHFRTAKKYSSGDSAPVRVLEPERQEILRQLGVATASR